MLVAASCAEACSTAADSSTAQGLDLQLLLHDFKQRGVVCYTLEDWLQAYAANTGQGPAAAQQQHNQMLDDVLVVEGWNGGFKPLLPLMNNRHAPTCYTALLPINHG